MVGASRGHGRHVLRSEGLACSSGVWPAGLGFGPRSLTHVSRVGPQAGGLLSLNLMLSQVSRSKGFVCFLTSERIRNLEAWCGYGAPDLGAPLQTSCGTGLALPQNPSTRLTLAPYRVCRSPGLPPRHRIGSSHCLLPARSPTTSTPHTRASTSHLPPSLQQVGRHGMF